MVRCVCVCDAWAKIAAAVDVDELVSHWQSHSRESKSDSLSLERNGGGAQRRAQADRAEAEAQRRTTAPWWRLLWVFLQRSALKQFREPESILFDVVCVHSTPSF